MSLKHKKKRVHFTLAEDVIEKLRLTAERKGCTMSELVNSSLRKHLPDEWKELDEQEQLFHVYESPK